jgi:hypothetical protein
MFRRVIRSPITFFDMNPVGKYHRTFSFSLASSLDFIHKYILCNDVAKGTQRG